MTRLFLGVALAGSAAVALARPQSGKQAPLRLNPIIELLEAGRPVFGLYAPANRRPRAGEPVIEGVPVKAPQELAREALGGYRADYLFDGSMERSYDATFETFAQFVRGMKEVGALMRFKSKGGTRPDEVGEAPALWGMSEKAYREKADLWPLTRAGELINFTIVESRAGLANLREIAAVPGIGVLFPGAGTLRGVFSSSDQNGRRVFDEQAWENAIQQVLAACKEFNVPCGYPASASDIELRMKQGFSVFVIGWGEGGFEAVRIGRRVAGSQDRNMRAIDRASWLAGCWELRSGNRLTLEMWMPPAGGSMLGASRTVVGGALREYEHTRIRTDGSTLVYVALPSGQKEAEFRSAFTSDTLLVFENPAHDFPQRIMYRRRGADSLIARSEGPGQNGARGVDYPMRRVGCTSP